MIFPSMPRSSKWHLIPPKPCTHTSSLTHMCPMPHPVNSSWFYQLDKICDKWKSRSNSVCNILWFPVNSPWPRPKCLPQDSILKHSQNGRPICAYLGSVWYVWRWLFTLCRSNLNPYCKGTKAMFFFSGHLNVRKYQYVLVHLGRQAAFKSTTL
jgi:hypothetical protein